MPLQSTSGTASYDAFGGGAAVEPVYIEQIFSTYLYTGNDTSQSITNNIDLSTKGGLVWIKGRAGYNGAQNHAIFDTARGANKWLSSNTTDAENTSTTNFLNAFNTTGFSITSTGNGRDIVNDASTTFASWTFRKQPKFFDVVTYTGNGTAGRTVAHNLGSVPGSIIVKSTSSLTNWHVYHRSLAVNQNLLLDLTQAARTDNSFNSTAPTATVFSLGGGATNTNGETYVAYLFAHNAGGFGLTGTDNVISCGSFTTDASGNATVNLGYEPQLAIEKVTSTTGNWQIYDTMRGFVASSSGTMRLNPNLSDAEAALGGRQITSTGMSYSGLTASATFIYIAIRRGPMKVPTSGTSVFSVDYQGQYTPKPPGHTSGFVTDMALVRNKNTTNDMINVSRLTGDNYLITSSTAAAGSLSFIDFDYMNGWGDLSTTDANYYSWMWRRAPSFFDEVCYTGNGTNGRAVTHNLGVAPEMIIVKKRTGADGWVVWASGLTSRLYELYLNDPRAQFVEVSPRLNVNNAPTSTQFEVGTDGEVNASGATYVSYLFATCPGVSKVGSYTGNGSTQTINCGFTGGARFVLIKRTDSTGDWYVYDTARGMTTLTDPYLLLNSTAAESATLGSVTTVSTGFAVNAAILAAINTNGASYIFFAVA